MSISASTSKFKKYDVLLFSVLFASIFFVHLLQFSGPSGVNGYFYLKQIKYFFSTQTLYFQDRSLAFALPFALRPILGSDLLTFDVCLSVVFAGFLWSQALIFKKIHQIAHLFYINYFFTSPR